MTLCDLVESACCKSLVPRCSTFVYQVWSSMSSSGHVQSVPNQQRSASSALVPLAKVRCFARARSLTVFRCLEWPRLKHDRFVVIVAPYIQRSEVINSFFDWNAAFVHSFYVAVRGLYVCAYVLNSIQVRVGFCCVMQNTWMNGKPAIVGCRKHNFTASLQPTRSEWEHPSIWA